MVQAPLSREYTDLSPEEACRRITLAKSELGSRLTVLGHHYQRDEIIRHADYRGDSYKLAKDAARTPDAEYIVFCGVHFMAESADLLTPPHQKVLLPNMAAGCSMADMANHFQVESCWRQLAGVLGDIEPTGSGKGIVPVTYINSAANLKAFVGRHGGTVCTSTNAPSAMEWALQRGDRVLFFPDQHLGRNTAFRMGIDPDTEMIVWDPYKPLGGNPEEQVRAARVVLWKGHCSVHMRFTVDQVADARAKHPGTKVVVHPECTLDVVQAADFSGSTEYIIHTVENAPAGTSWAVGTEINLVRRLASENPDKTVACLDSDVCPCSTMYRIHPSFLCWLLEELVQGRVHNHVQVADEVAGPARTALQRMLEIGVRPTD